jgi:hypothetical protein
MADSISLPTVREDVAMVVACVEVRLVVDVDVQGGSGNFVVQKDCAAGYFDSGIKRAYGKLSQTLAAAVAPARRREKKTVIFILSEGAILSQF